MICYNCDKAPGTGLCEHNRGFTQQNKVEQTWNQEKHQAWQQAAYDTIQMVKDNYSKERTMLVYPPPPKSNNLKIATNEGVKHDSGKPDLSHISQELMVQVARVREFGEHKYSRDNWRKGFKFNRSIAAALRHIVAFKEGEDLDPESGLSHIAHAVCCLEHLLNDIKNHPNNDDRNK